MTTYNRVKQVAFIFFLMANIFPTFAQIKGTVSDSKNQPLAFVNIYIENTFTGTTSNEDGIYELSTTKTGTYTIVFQYLGYKTVKEEIQVEKFPFTFDAILYEEKISLDEVIINANENPADKIIRSTIAKREEYLKKMESYKADFYSRGLIRIKDAPEKILGQDIGDLGGGLDSTRSGIIYLSETISKIQFLRPDKLKETITASKVSGKDNGFSFNNAIDVDYNFYNNTIELGNNIISPIANNAFSYYHYKLEGVFYDDKGNLINKVAVIPKRKNDPIFSGFIYIIENQWAIYALELDITGTQARIPAIDIITLKQNFSYSQNESIWAIISQNIDFEYSLFGIKGNGRFIANYSDYEFNAGLSKKSFSREIVSFANEANKKDSIFWKTARPVPLTIEESTDYINKDSIQVIRKSKIYLDSTDTKRNKFKFGNLLSGYNYKNTYKGWSTGISSPVSTLTFNTIQGWNVNIAGYYRKNYDEFKRYLSINGTINYGFSEDRLRGTLTTTYKFNDTSKPFLTLSGGVTTQQFNANNPISTLLNTYFSLYSERNYLKIYDKSFAQISYSDEIFNGLRMGLSVSYERRKPLFNTTDQVWYPKDDKVYTSNNPLDETAYGVAPFITHNILKFSLDARINFEQNYLSYPDSKFNIPNAKYPTLYLGFEKGFASNITDYNFDQIKLRVTQSLDVKDKGQLAYNIKSGKFFNAENIAFVDYQHFNGNQTNIGGGSYLNVFNNLPYYTASSNDAYLEMHAEHDFNGFILGKIPLLNKLNFNLVIGAHTLAVPENKPYQEYTIGLDNIGWGKFRFLRIDYLRSYQSGFQSDAIIFGLKLF